MYIEERHVHAHEREEDTDTVQGEGSFLESAELHESSSGGWYNADSHHSEREELRDEHDQGENTRGPVEANLICEVLNQKGIHDSSCSDTSAIFPFIP